MGENAQLYDYYPFGLSFNSWKREDNKKNDYLYNGIERQDELDLGWDLAEFRSYSPEIGRWHQIDPKTSERESGYVGFANNPILYADYLGDTVIITGKATDKAVEHLNSGLKGMATSVDDDGKLSYTLNEGEKLNRKSKKHIKAIESGEITINIRAIDNSQNNDGGAVIGGEFQGTTVIVEEGTVDTKNIYDATTGGKIDNAFKKPGSTVIHEITEGYEAGKISLKKGVSSGNGNTDGSVYKKAHRRAANKAGKIKEYVHYENNVATSLIYTAKGQLIYIMRD